MKRTIIIILMAALLMFPGFSAAQKHGSSQSQHKSKNSIMHTNMGMLADMMSKMSKMMSKGNVKPEQQKRCAEFMAQMSQIMREMSVPHGKDVKEQHQQQLQEMEKEFNPLLNHLVHPG